MRSRGLVIMVAALLATLATAAVFLYVRGIKDDRASQADLVSVIVAKDDIPVGTNLDDLISSGGLTLREVPQDAVVRGAITDVELLRGRSTNAPIVAGEQITSARLEGSATQPQGGALGIPEGYQAITLNLSAPQAAGGSVQDGDHITIYATFDDITVGRASVSDFVSGDAPADNETLKLGDFTVTVVPDVQVLKVVSQDITATNTDSTIALTMALTAEDAAHVIFATQKGTVWMALLPPGEEGTTVPPTNVFDIVDIAGIN
jgi:pilus assembly protein CpaB